LHDPRSQIRLLEVLPGTEAIIKCRLRSVPLANAGNYEALSYHWWGDVMENHVYVNGVDVPVHGNLYNALGYLRYAKKPRVLWVDAICIDQSRNEEHGEKSHQLQLMSHIYRQARRTVAYIG
ncbi:heterokaryon incompatibility protein-domain-containing protein, partial [Phaeosphaeriaceae sp. PMI808]